MLKPLSIWAYYLNNKSKIIPVVIIITLSVFALITGSTLLNFVNKETNKFIEYYKQYYSLQVGSLSDPDTTKVDLYNEIQSYSQTDKIVTNFYRQKTYVLTPLGETPRFVDFIESSFYKEYSNQMGWEIIEGRMPRENTNEIILSKNILLNKGLSVGDEIGSFVDKDESLYGQFKIVGSLSDKYVSGGFGNLTYMQQFSQQNPDLAQDLILIQPVKGKEYELHQRLVKLVETEPGLVLWTQYNYADFLAQNYSIYNQIKVVITLVVSIVIALSVGLLQIIFFSQRMREFGLLSAIGYGKLYIIKKSNFELFGMTLVAWITGLIFTQLIFNMLNETIMEAKGLDVLTIFDLDTMIYSLPIPLAVVSFSMLTMVWNLLKMDSIQVIEKRL